MITPGKNGKWHITNPGSILAFLNADWRDFESTPAKQESPDHAITLFDFHRLLSGTGWKITHRKRFQIISLNWSVMRQTLGFRN